MPQTSCKPRNTYTAALTHNLYLLTNTFKIEPKHTEHSKCEADSDKLGHKRTLQYCKQM